MFSWYCYRIFWSVVNSILEVQLPFYDSWFISFYFWFTSARPIIYDRTTVTCWQVHSLPPCNSFSMSENLQIHDKKINAVCNNRFKMHCAMSLNIVIIFCIRISSIWVQHRFHDKSKNYIFSICCTKIRIHNQNNLSYCSSMSLTFILSKKCSRQLS